MLWARHWQSQWHTTEVNSLEKIDYLTLQFLSAGGDPFNVWIDGLSFE